MATAAVDEFDVVVENPNSEPWPSELTVDLPNFCMNECTDIQLLGLGTFGEVSVCMYHGHRYLLKHLNVLSDRSQARDMYLKELRLLESLRGHPNVVDIRGYCYAERAFTLEYVRFSFDCLNIECGPVSSLDKFLTVCNEYTKFRGCKHLPLHIGMDIASGLQFLHSKGVVHRDLKSENVLVCNRHYTEQQECAFRTSWTSNPVVCKLSDFGESRSRVCKTRVNVTATRTHNIARGSLVYRAPESFQMVTAGYDIAGLKSMDLWSFAMIIFELLNPNTFAYQHELENAPETITDETVIQQAHRRKKLPAFDVQYLSEQQSVWQPLKKVYDRVAVYNAASRPSADDIVHMLVTEHVSVIQLPLSQTNVSSMFLGRGAHIHSLQTKNACTFIAVVIADHVLKMSAGRTVSTDDLCSIATDAVINFPKDVNKVRKTTEMYGILDAYKILRSVNACGSYELKFSVFSSSVKSSVSAKEELRTALSIELQRREPFCAMYTVPPYTVLICSTSEGSLSVVDTHAVSSYLNGDCRNGVIVHCLNTVTALAGITNWLFARLFGTAVMVEHELAILVPEHDAAVGYSGSASGDEQTVTLVENTSKPAQTVSIFTDRALAAGIQPTTLTEFPHCRKWAQTARPPADIRPIAIVRPTSSIPCHLKSLNADASSSAQHQCSPPGLPSVVSGTEALSSSAEQYIMSSTEELVIHVPSDSDDTNMDWELLPESPAQVPLDQNSLQESSATPCRLTEEQVEGTQAEDHMNLWMSCSAVEDEVRYLNILQNNG